MSWTAPSRPSSKGNRDGAGNLQGVEMPKPLVNVQKGAQKTTTTRRYQDTVRHEAGDKEAQRRMKGGQGIKARPPSRPAETRPQVKDGRRE